MMSPLSLPVRYAVLFALIGNCVWAQDIDHHARARSCLAVLQQWYQPESGQWSTTSWWNAANALTGIVEYTRVSGDATYRDVIANTFDRCKRFTVEGDPDNPPWVCSDFINAWYDDEGWWVLVWLDAYDLTREQRYLDMAKITFADMTKGWDEVCDGGVYWKKPDIGKHTITNGLFMAGALRLHQRSPGSVKGKTYRQWGDASWNWIKSHQLVNDDFLLENGLDDQCRLQRGALYTYNQGVVLGALVEYFLVTKDNSHLELAEKIAQSTIAKLADQSGILRDLKEPQVTGDSAQFKGVFMRNLSRLYRLTKNEQYRQFILSNAQSIWAKARDPKTGQFGALWNGPFDAGDAARQSSALDALNAAIVVSTHNQSP